MKNNTESREYCFVIMSYLPESTYNLVYNQLCNIIEGYTGLSCKRADKVPEPGNYLLGKVHDMILKSSIVVADVSEYSPNVYYEYGYASAHDRKPILIARKDKELPTDLVGKETLRYDGFPENDIGFINNLKVCLVKELRSPLPEQRRMLSSPNPFPAFIVAAPRVPGEGSKHWWHPDEQQTFGDNLGISGILSAYGNMYGTHSIPDLLNGQSLAGRIPENPGNFYCIGSSKMNKATEYFLPLVQENLIPLWEMPQIGEGKDKRVIFKGVPELDAFLSGPISKAEDGSMSDYGLIIRAPHPNDVQRLVLIVAGRHSIGTHAACMMVTQQKLIVVIEKELEKIGITLGDSGTPFWAIVKGTLLANGNMKPDVEVIKIGGYKAKGV
jgi:hypothetical protein